ncbi:MAG TPA: glycerophosphodiester phosphodiesterase family protein [Steroidobacteraceae bacterium]|nr:glycerophosphodiester phosphodiesterase family protein [Steroidobacteraceae bacterium]
MIDVQGHRGARGLWPENTLAGFARALELGVSAVELDCGMTRDGVLVVAHDPELNPDCTRDAAGRYLERSGPAIFALSYQELLAYDVGRLRPGSAYAARFPAQQAVDGERIPRLADVLGLVRTRGRGRVRVAVEVKTFPERPQLTAAPEPLARALEQTLTGTGSASLVSIMAFDWRVLAAVQRLMPQVPTVALTEQQPGEDTVRIGSARVSPWLGGLDPERFGGSVVRLVQASGAGAWGPDYRDLDARLIEQAHALGLRVVPWTVDEPADMERLLGFNVDGMTTDRPDVLRALLERKGLAVPPRPGEYS